MDLAALFGSAYGYSHCSILSFMRSDAGNISQLEVIHHLTQIDSDKSFLHVDDIKLKKNLSGQQPGSSHCFAIIHSRLRSVLKS